MGKDHSSKFVGLDVHKNTITITVANDGPDGEVRLYGTIQNTLEEIDKVIRKLLSDGSQLYFVYEAGPCGFVLSNNNFGGLSLDSFLRSLQH